jgi:hypothetical protein
LTHTPMTGVQMPLPPRVREITSPAPPNNSPPAASGSENNPAGGIGETQTDNRAVPTDAIASPRLTPEGDHAVP